MDQRLVQKLAASGVLSEDWALTFLAVPRRQFLPDRLWVLENQDRMYHPVVRDDDPERWNTLADSDAPLVTQVDNGRPIGPDGLGDVPTSSSSMPHMVALMLKHLEVRSGDRALEIGTGTGWNAALLAHRLEADRVVTIEIDPEVAEQARGTLAAAGFDDVTVVTGNGSDGYPDEAPYHRVISTTACHTVPYAWVEQTRAGGRIVTPWGTEFHNWALLALDVHDHKAASGYVVGTAAFMRMRDQRIPYRAVEPTDEETAAATARKTSLKPADVMLSNSVLMAMSARVHQCQATYREPAKDPDGEARLILFDHRTGSWARLYARPDDDEPRTVLQGGPRQLFDEVEAAYQWWTEQGCPTAGQWHVIVDSNGQRIELT